MKTRIILIGGFRKTITLAKSLLSKGYRVTAINDDPAKCQTLAGVDGLKVILGDGTVPSVLSDAGADNCQIAIALTNKDEDNLIACQLCKKRFNVKKTISLVSSPNKRDFFTNMGIDSVICAVDKITAIIEQQAIVDEIANSIAVAEGKICITEIKIQPDAEVVGKKISEINLPREIIIGFILRGSGSVIPRGNTELRERDTLILISEGGEEDAAVKVLSEKARP